MVEELEPKFLSNHLMENQIIINTTFNETRVALGENGTITEIYVERQSHPRTVGNIYKGRVDKIVPGMQAAFIEMGLEKSGFISVEDVTEDSFLDFFLGAEDEDSGENDWKQPIIQDILREGQELLVQIIKEPTGAKGPKLSSNIALPGKYLVLLGTVDIVGISRRIYKDEERQRLSEILSASKPPGTGLIARTASVGVGEGEILNELEYLKTLWEEIKSKSENQKAPSFLYREPKLCIRAVRDLLTQDVKTVVMDSKEVYDELQTYLKENFNGVDVKLKLYEDPTPIFTHFGVDSELEKIAEKKVWLKSGGYLIIDIAEALTVIDVNTGKYLKGKNQDDTIFDINLEAAQEIARQIRLRNLVGIIVIDFIDMKDSSKRKEVYNTFTKALKRDKARSVVLEMSLFGVVQLTRQRIRENLLSTIAEPCEQCAGTGYVKSVETSIYEIIRALKSRLESMAGKKITVAASKTILQTLQSLEGENLRRLEAESDVEILSEELRNPGNHLYEIRGE